MTSKRWLILILVLAAAVFAVQGGEYSTAHWLELRAKEQAERQRVADLRREVDSLRLVKKLVETDPATQERLARELYGMLRPGETEFTLVRPERR
jgi:cell division protein FtsB